MGRVFLHLKVVDAPSAAIDNLTSLGGDAQRPEIVHFVDASDASQPINSTTAPVEEKGKLYQAVGKLLERLERLQGFKSVVDALSEVSSIFRRRLTAMLTYDS